MVDFRKFSFYTLLNTKMKTKVKSPTQRKLFGLRHFIIEITTPQVYHNVLQKKKFNCTFVTVDQIKCVIFLHCLLTRLFLTNNDLGTFIILKLLMMYTENSNCLIHAKDCMCQILPLM
jgi:hypothetical protein